MSRIQNHNFNPKLTLFQAQILSYPSLNIRLLFCKYSDLLDFKTTFLQSRQDAITDTKTINSRQKRTDFLSFKNHSWYLSTGVASLMVFFSTTTPCISLLTDHKSEVGFAGKLEHHLLRLKMIVTFPPNK